MILVRKRILAAAFAVVTALVLTGLPTLQPDVPLPAPEEKSGPRAGFPDEFIRYHNWIRAEEGRVGAEDGPEYDVGYRYDELGRARTRQAVAKRRNPPMSWTERGPANVGGRTRTLLVDAADPTGATWFAGSAGGGVWMTSDRGVSWTHVTEGLPNLAFSSLAQSASDPNVIYAGSGEGFFNGDALQGAGIFKSTDHGQSWIRLSSTNRYDFRYVNRLIANPQDADEVVAATREGLFRTVDGGASWTEVLEARGLTGYTQVIMEPRNFDVQYAAESGYGVWKSIDAGQTWSLHSDGLSDRYGGAIQVTGAVPGSRFEIGISPVQTDRLLVLIESESFTDRLYLSDDGAESWHPVSEAVGVGPDVGETQGWYDLAVAAHPYDPDVFFVGGVKLFRVTLGGEAPTTARVTADDSDTRSFQDYIDFGGPQLRGGLRAGIDDDESTIAESEMTSVEIRYGAGRSQKAHRFTPPDGPGIDFAEYPYADYVDVPFEVWDVENDRQLMVSFRDRNADGEYDLTQRDDFDLGREYVLIHAVEYNPDQPDPQISAPGGLPHKLMYFYWPILAHQAVWEPESMDPAVLRLQFFESSDGTARTTSEIGRSIHVDQHAIVPIPQNEALNDFDLVVTNDGGVYFSGDGGQSWIKRNSGYNTAQFYGVDRMPGGDRYVGGMQDNGTYSSVINANASSTWFEELGGDGFDAVWHDSDDNRLLGTIQFNRIRRSVNGGQSWSSATAGLTDQGSSLDGAPFVTSIAGAHENPDVVYTIGESGIWKSTDFAESWDLRPIPASDFGFSSGGKVRVSLADDDVVWGGYFLSSGSGSTLHLSTDGGETFERVDGPLYSPGRISGLATHPTEPGTAYVLFSAPDRPKVLRTTDFGETWDDLSGYGSPPTKVKVDTGFPDVAVYDLLVHPSNQDILLAGTEIGLFISGDGGQSWSIAEGNLPATAIWRLKLVEGQVVAATHGRGIWTLPLSAVHTAADETAVLPDRFELKSVFPNPFASTTTVEYALDQPSRAEISVFDLTGRRVATLVDSEQPAGIHRIEWQADGLAAGNYLIRLSGSAGSSVRSVVKVR